VIVQGGAYGEHQTKQVRINGKVTPVDGPCFEVQLAPGTGARLVIDMKRYANQPTLAHPWDRAHRVKN
jgi:hypothetical protein